MSSLDNDSGTGTVVPGADSVVFGRSVVPVPNRNKKPRQDLLGAEYAEHCFIGDAITLTLANETEVAASEHAFTLSNQLKLTYGQINGLAGDFYGTYDPISDGINPQDQSTRFVSAYNTLATDTRRQPAEANAILDVLQAEVNAVNRALANHEDPSVVYSQLPDVSIQLEAITYGRSGIPGYLGLAQINWDHFGADARTSYNAGHATAIQKAISGDLEGAYAMNAFADHFLEDSFAAGHLRTPRRLLHSKVNPASDLCAKYMHDEDNAIGISVKNPAGWSWTAYGDKRALDDVAAENKNYCVNAVQASAKEIYQAYKTRQAPSPDKYQAWTHAPTLESANAQQTLATLFNIKNERRSLIKNRKLWEFIGNWTYIGTALECQLSGWWKYPITIDGVKDVLTWTSFASVTPSLLHLQVFYQKPGGAIDMLEHVDGKWYPEISVFSGAALFTPLAAVSWENGQEIRVYYVDEKYILQEYCYSSDKGSWFPGELGSFKIQVAPNTSLSALQYGDDQGGVNIRVYFQDPLSFAIQEWQNNGTWNEGGHDLPIALSGSSLSAVCYMQNGLQIRLYYQAGNLSLKEHCFSQSGDWYSGEFNPGRVPGRVPIDAIVSNGSGDSKFHVYWRNIKNQIVEITNIRSQWSSLVTVVEGLNPGRQLSVAQWDNGKELRLYYQGVDNSIVEMQGGSGGDNCWSGGSVVAESA